MAGTWFKHEFVALGQTVPVGGDKLVDDLVGAGLSQPCAGSHCPLAQFHTSVAVVETSAIAEGHPKTFRLTAEVQENVIGGEGNCDGAVGDNRVWRRAAVLDSIVGKGGGGTEEQGAEQSSPEKV